MHKTWVPATPIILGAAIIIIGIGCSNSTAPAPVANVFIYPLPFALHSGDSAQFSARTTDSDGNTLTGRVVTWHSDNVAIATVSATGLVSAHTSGTVHVTATSEGVSASVAITVTLLITVQVTPCCSPSVALNGHQQFTATIANDPGNGGVTWGVVDGVGDPCDTVCGTLSATTSASGAAITYAAPARSPEEVYGGANLLLYSNTDPSKQAFVHITLTPP